MSRSYEPPEDRIADALERIADLLDGRNHRMATAVERIAGTLEEGLNAINDGLAIAMDVGMAHVELQAIRARMQCHALDVSDDVAKSVMDYIDEVMTRFLETDDDESEPTNAEES